MNNDELEMIKIFKKLFTKIELWEGYNNYLVQNEEYKELKEKLYNYINKTYDTGKNEGKEEMRKDLLQWLQLTKF